MKISPQSVSVFVNRAMPDDEGFPSMYLWLLVMCTTLSTESSITATDNPFSRISNSTELDVNIAYRLP